MADIPDRESAHSDGDDWLVPSYVVAPADATEAADPPRRSFGRIGGAVGLLLAGGVAGAIAVNALSGSSATQAAATTPAANQFQGSVGQGGPAGGVGGSGSSGSGGFAGGPGGGFAGGPGGIAGEQHVSGTLTAVGSDTVTVKTASSSATYTVTATTEIVRNGAQATLSTLKVGDPVFLHVYPSGSGSTMLVERLFAGTLPAGGPRGGVGGFGGSDGTAPDGTAPGTRT